MQYKSENQIKMALGINNWRNMLNEKLTRFTTMMPSVERGVLADVIGELPQFRELARDTLILLESRHAHADVDLDEFSTQFRYDLADLRKILAREINWDKNTSEEKRLFMEKILFVLDGAVDDQADIRFVQELQKADQLSTRLIVISALVFLGGRLLLDSKGESES